MIRDTRKLPGTDQTHGDGRRSRCSFAEWNVSGSGRAFKRFCNTLTREL